MSDAETLIVYLFSDACPETLVDLCERACAADKLLTARHDPSTLEVGFGTVARARAEAERAAELRFSTPSNAWQEYVASAHDEYLPAPGGDGDVFSSADWLLLLEGAVAHLHSADADDALHAAGLGSLLHADEPLFAALHRLGLVAEVLRPHAPHAREHLWRTYGLRLLPMLSDGADAPRVAGAPAANCLDAICAYFGSSVALYFAWLQHTLCWYAPIGLSGVAVWLYHRTCAVRIELSVAAPIFSLGAVVWAAAMHRCWRRRAARLALRWGTFEHGSAAHAEPARPGFRGVPRQSPVTGLAEDYFAPIRRLPRYAVSACATAAMLALSASAMAASLSVQGLVVAHGPFGALAALRALSAPGGPLDPARGALYGWLPSVGHVCFMRLMNGLYSHVAAALTEFENHRTETDAANALLLKRFCFEAFDAYGTLLYIALVKRDVQALRAELIGLYSTDAARRILTEAALPWAQQRLGDALGARRAPRAAPQPQSPALAARAQDAAPLPPPRSKASAEPFAQPLAEHDADKAQPPEPATPAAESAVALLSGDSSSSSGSSGSGGSPATAARGGRWASELGACEYEAFDDQLEMVVQLGYVLLFAAAFPLAGCLSLVCTAVEFQSDLWRLAHVARRPPPRRARDLGAWLWVLGALSLAAVPTNLAIAAYASDQLEQFLPAGFFVPHAEQLARAAPHAGWLGGGARVLLAGARCALPSARRAGCGALLRAGVGASAAASEDFAIDDVAPGARASVALALLAIEHALALCALLLAAALPPEPEEVTVARARSAWVTAVKARAARRGGLEAAQHAADEQAGARRAADAPQQQWLRGPEAAASLLERIIGASRGGGGSSGLLMRRRLSAGDGAGKPALTIAVPVAGLTPGAKPVATRR